MYLSHSLRSAWIEIRPWVQEYVEELVALLTECVDRNSNGVLTNAKDFPVALLTECVDRNYSTPTHIISFTGRTPYGVRG